MLDLISIGNITIDLFFKGDSLTQKDKRFQLALGGKYVAEYFHESLGGGGANVAIGVRRNGLKTAVIAKIGDNPFKSIIIDKLKKEKVSTKLLQRKKEYTAISTILLGQKGDRSIINYETPRQHLFTSNKIMNNLLNTKAVYLGNLPDVLLSERIKALSYLRRNNILTIVNLGVKDCRREIKQLEPFLNKINILILNAHEFSELVKKKYEDIDFTKKINKYRFLKDKILIITDGKKGSYAFDNKRYYQKAKNVENIIDATGTGDAYTSAFIANYLQTKDIQISMEKGSSYASKILLRIGAN